jgi:hypothetical protein
MQHQTSGDDILDAFCIHQSTTVVTEAVAF